MTLRVPRWIPAVAGMSGPRRRWRLSNQFVIQEGRPIKESGLGAVFLK